MTPDPQTVAELAQARPVDNGNWVFVLTPQHAETAITGDDDGDTNTLGLG